MPPAWVIIQTKPAAEEIAERSLQQAGYRIYLPRFRKLLTPHGRLRRGTTIMRPLFPRVLFAQDWHGWPDTPILGTTGVMMLSGGKAARLSAADIALIVDRERRCEFDEIRPGGRQEVRTDLKSGDEVEFQAFGSKVLAVLTELTPDGRALVEALLFSGSVQTEVDADQLHKRTSDISV